MIEALMVSHNSFKIIMSQECLSVSNCRRTVRNIFQIINSNHLILAVVVYHYNFLNTYRTIKIKLQFAHKNVHLPETLPSSF